MEFWTIGILEDRIFFDEKGKKSRPPLRLAGLSFWRIVVYFSMMKRATKPGRDEESETRTYRTLRSVFAVIEVALAFSRSRERKLISANTE